MSAAEPSSSSGRARIGGIPIAGTLGVFLAVAAGVGLLFQSAGERRGARAAFPTTVGPLAVSGLGAPVEVFRDRSGVPHVEAASESDALFGLGFVHAQDRLAQMLWLLRSAQGRTAEVVGEEGLAADRLARTLGIARLAGAEFEALDPDTRELLDAYAAGVNARIDRLRTREVALPLALEGSVPGAAPRGELPLEDWRPEDSLAVLKLYAWDLSGSLDVSLVLSDVVKQLGRLGARHFLPWGPDRTGPPGGRQRITAGIRPLRHSTSPWVPDPLKAASGMAGRSIGSSAWLVGGRHTASGAPILVADAHLPPRAPALYHVDHIRGGALDVAGATLPGVPIVWTGTNTKVVWASTHARAVTTDLYEERVHATDPNLYHDGRVWRSFENRVEEIGIRDQAPVTLEIRSSRHGPIIETPEAAEDEPLALAWAGAVPGGGQTLDAFFAVARAESVAEVTHALRSHREPPLAVVYADGAGAGRLQVAGWVPQREFSHVLIPLPGRARWYEWRGPVPFDELPAQDLSRRATGDDWLIAADNTLAEPRNDAVEWLWRTGERAERIDALLREQTGAGPVDLRAMAAVQSDVVGARARTLVARALRLASPDPSLEAEAAEIAQLLSRWDGYNDADSVGAAVYHVFLAKLTEHLFSPRLGEDLARRYMALAQTDSAQVIHELLDDLASGHETDWGDLASLRAAVRASLRETWFRLSFDLGPNRSRWQWGRLHPLRFVAFGASANRRVASGLGPFPFGGSGSTINAAEYKSDDGFEVRVASIFRFAVDVAAMDESLFSLAPGQSEHPRHPHFTGGLSRWLEGRPTLLATSRLMVEEAGVEHLTLSPAQR